jgi:hypothetical protein
VYRHDFLLPRILTVAVALKATLKHSNSTPWSLNISASWTFLSRSDSWSTNASHGPSSTIASISGAVRKQSGRSFSSHARCPCLFLLPVVSSVIKPATLLPSLPRGSSFRLCPRCCACLNRIAQPSEHSTANSLLSPMASTTPMTKFSTIGEPISVRGS